MTAQFQERLSFRGKHRGMAAEPLNHLFAAGVPRPPFVWQSTACWRGYIGDWEVRDDRLYLIGLEARVAASDDPESRLTRDFGLRDLFPDAPPGGVLADWVTDWLRVPDGEMLRYVHMGYGSTFERDLSLVLHRGRLIGVRVRDNRTGEVRPIEFTPRVDDLYGEEAGFLRAIHAHPTDSLTKLVYADWLDERDDPRGQLLRADVDLAGCDEDRDRTIQLTEIRRQALTAVKDWFWMKLIDSPLPTDEHGWESRDW